MIRKTTDVELQCQNVLFSSSTTHVSTFPKRMRNVGPNQTDPNRISRDSACRQIRISVFEKHSNKYIR